MTVLRQLVEKLHYVYLNGKRLGKLQQVLEGQGRRHYRPLLARQTRGHLYRQMLVVRLKAVRCTPVPLLLYPLLSISISSPPIQFVNHSRSPVNR